MQTNLLGRLCRVNELGQSKLSADTDEPTRDWTGDAEIVVLFEVRHTPRVVVRWLVDGSLSTLPLAWLLIGDPLESLDPMVVNLDSDHMAEALQQLGGSKEEPDIPRMPKPAKMDLSRESE